MLSTFVVALALSVSPLLAQSDPFLQDTVPAADVVTRPKVITNRQPAYTGNPVNVPEGQLRAEFIVERDGAVRSIRFVGSSAAYRQIEDETSAAMRTWKFEPGLKDGKAVRVLATVTVTFAMTQLPARGSVRQGVMATLVVDGVDDTFAEGIAHYSSRPAGLTWPTILKEVKPIYPPEAKDDRVNGQVELEIVVLATGKVGAVRITRSPDSRFDEAAVRAARQWIFAPAKKDGQPVPMVVALALDFRIR